MPLLLALLAGAGPPARAEPLGEAAGEAASVDLAKRTVAADDAEAMAAFLDSLMLAESGGRDLARNPRSTAVGAFQFVEATFLEVVRRNFAAETAALTPSQILALRTDRAFARKAAEAYTRDNAGHLATAGIRPTFAHLRLAHLVGPSAAVRVIRMPAQTPAALVLGPAAIRANPFLAGYTTADLVARAAREAGTKPQAAATVTPRAATAKAARPAPAITAPCNLRQPSCRRWLALAERRHAKGRLVSTR